MTQARLGARGDAGRAAWGPEPDAPPVAVVALRAWDADLLARVGAVAGELGVPVQAVRGDRVLSLEHLWMAYAHHERGIRHGRARAQDPGLDFLRYAAAKRQIKDAIAALGVPLEAARDERARVPVVLVALGRVDEPGLLEVAGSKGLAAVPVGPRRSSAPHEGDVFSLAKAAERYWRERLGLSPDASRDETQARLFSAMVLVALDVRRST